ncbi:MAG TPA: WG repeat-containing protein [Phnomibacter sp.]|nr:WG repeat-containing protein [Phnomibacter sp.]
MYCKFYDEAQDLYGYKTEVGVIAIPALYERATDFTKEVAVVGDGIHYGLIHSGGDLLIPIEYDSMIAGRDGWVHAKKNEIDFLLSHDGKLHLQLPEVITWYSPTEELIRVKKATGWGFLNMQGEEVIACVYKSLGPCVHGRISFFDDGYWGWLNRNGEIIVPAQFGELGIWNDQLWWGKQAGVYRLYNQTNELVQDDGWLKIIPPGSGAAVVKTAAGWKFIAADFSTILQLPEQYSYAEPFVGEYAAVKQNESWGFINKKGEEIIAPQYEAVGNFSESLCAVKLDDRWGYINPKAELVIPCRYVSAGRFEQGKACVHDGWYHYWFINPAGETISEMIPMDE